MISACVLVRTEKGKFEDVARKIEKFKGIKRAFPTFGRFDIVVDLEADSYEKLGNTVLRIGQLSGVVFTETLVEVVKK